MNKNIDMQAYWDFKRAVDKLRIRNVNQDQIDQLKQQLDAIIKSK
jgi:polyhydroxyalkanoate synthesis regulator protein